MAWDSIEQRRRMNNAMHGLSFGRGDACTAFPTQFSGPKTCTSALALEESIDSPRDKKRQAKTANGSERRATHTSTNTSQARGGAKR